VMAGGSSMSFGSPSMSEAPAGLSVADLAVELLGLAHAAGRPPHLVLIDVATPGGSASGPSVSALARRIASRVYDQLPPSARLYLLEHDAVAVALLETDPQAVTRWVRTVSTGLSMRWPELAAELPRAVFRIDVRRLDEDRTFAEQLWDLRVDRAAPTGEPSAQLAGPQLPEDGGPPTGRHIAGPAEPPPMASDPVANWINARPGSGGRRRRPDDGGGYPGPPSTQDEWGTSRQGTPGGRSVGPLTSNYQNGASALLGGRMIGDPPAFEGAEFSAASSRLAVVDPPAATPRTAHADPARTTRTGAEPPPVTLTDHGQAAHRAGVGNGHAADWAAGSNGHAVDRTAGTNGHAADRTAGANGHALDWTAGTNGHAVQRTSGANGHAVDRASAHADAVDRAAGTNGYAVDRARGTNGRAVDRAAGTNGHMVDPAGGTNGHMVDRAAGTNGHAVARPDGTNGYLVDRAAGTNGHVVERTAGTNWHAVDRVDGSNGHAVERTAGISGDPGERAEPGDGHAAEPGEVEPGEVEPGEVEPDGGKPGRNGRRGPRNRGQAGARASDSTPLSELSFAELLAGALAAYRET
jgi:hypothetical protein